MIVAHGESILSFLRLLLSLSRRISPSVPLSFIYMSLSHSQHLKMSVCLRKVAGSSRWWRGTGGSSGYVCFLCHLFSIVSRYPAILLARRGGKARFEGRGCRRTPSTCAATALVAAVARGQSPIPRCPPCNPLLPIGQPFQPPSSPGC